MAGHSKWANIQHRKSAQDAKRAQLFGKLIREITVSVRLGGPDPNHNPQLRDAIARAYKNSMKRSNIENAIKKGSQSPENQSLDFVCYEGYGPAGIALLIHGLTDNRNRTVSEVRHTLSKYGGNLGAEGSVAYLFKSLGVISLSAPVSEEEVMDIALDYAVEDMVTQDNDQVTVYTAPESFNTIQQAFIKVGFSIAQAEITFIPTTHMILEKLADARRLLTLVDQLEHLDDVQQVYCNAEISDTIAQQMADGA